MSEEKDDHEFYYATNDRLKVPNLDQLLLITAPNIELEQPPYDPKKKISVPDSRIAKEKDIEENVDREQKKIRWKIGNDGKIESNARLIKWSDGSYQLAIGDLLFDVETTKLHDTSLYSECKDEVLVSQKTIDEKATLHYASDDPARGDQFYF